MPKIKRITLSIGFSKDISSSTISDDGLKKAVSETRWQKGEGVIGGRTFMLYRRAGLDGFEYRLGESVLAEGSVEAFNPTEYFDWRDEK